jgi:hypothetical protein
VSGPKLAYYVVGAVAAAALARRAAQARAQEIAEAERIAANREWAAVQARHQALEQRAQRVRSADPSAAVPEIVMPGVPYEIPTHELRERARSAAANADQLEQQVQAGERAARNRASMRTVAGILGPAPAQVGPDRRVAAPVAPKRPAPVAEARRRDVTEALARDMARDMAKADELAARLAAGVNRSPRMNALLDELPTESDASRRRLLLDQLRADVGSLNAAAAAAAARTKARAAAELTLAATDDLHLRKVLQDPDAGAAALEAGAAAAENRARAARERDHVQQVVVEVFKDLHYDVESGFDVHTPSGGVLVGRGVASHGVQVNVENGVVNLAAVRLYDGGPDKHTPADLRAEQALCELEPRVWARLRSKDVELSGVSGQPVGAVVPKTAQVKKAAGGAGHASGPSIAKPHQREMT